MRGLCQISLLAEHPVQWEPRLVSSSSLATLEPDIPPPPFQT